MAGAAVATVLAQWSGAAVFLVLLYAPGARIAPARSLPTLRDLLPFLHAGGALAMRTYVLFTVLAAATAVAARVGVVEVAAEARAVARRLLGMGLSGGALLGAGIGLPGEVLPRAFSSEPAVVATVASLMIFVALMQPINALLFVWEGI